MATRLDEQAHHWAEMGILKHYEQQRLLEEKKPKGEEIDLSSLRITASDSVKDITSTSSEAATSRTITSSLNRTAPVTVATTSGHINPKTKHKANQMVGPSGFTKTSQKKEQKSSSGESSNNN